MSWSSMSELIGLFGACAALLFFLLGARTNELVGSKGGLCALLALVWLNCLVDFTEATAVAVAFDMDVLEDTLDLVLVLAWLFFLYSCTQGAANRRLRESEQRFQLLLDSLPEYIWLAGTDKLCTDFNKSWSAFTGRTMKQEVGKGWTEGVHPEDVDRFWVTYASAFDARQPFTMEYRLRRHDGQYRWILDTGVPYRQPNGEFAGYIGSCLDITDRTLTELALRESEQRLQVLLSSLDDVVWSATADGQVQYVNSAVERVYGRPQSQFLENPELWLQTVHPDDRDSVRRASLEIFDRGNMELQYRIVRADGQLRWISDRKKVVLDDDGTPISMVGVATDITEQKRAEETLRQTEARNRALLQAVPDLMFRIRRDGTFIDFQSRDEHLLALPPEQFLYKRIDQCMPAEFAAVMNSKIRATLETGRMQTIEYRLATVLAPNEQIDYEARIVASGEDEVMAIVRDVSDRKQAEEQLQWQSQLLDSVQESIVATDLDGIVTYWGKGAQALYSYTPEEVLGKHIAFIAKQDEREQEQQRLRHVLDTGYWRGQYVQRRRDGTSFWADAFISLVKDAHGIPCGFIGIDRDITERKRAEQALRESEEKLRDLVENMPAFVCYFDLDGTICFINRTQPGLEFSQVIGASLYDFIDPRDVPELKGLFDRVGKTGSSGEMEFRGTGQHGQTGWYFSRFGPVKKEGRIVGVSCIAEDITERKRAQEQVMRLGRIVEDSLDEIYIFDAETLRFLQVNRGGRDNLGYTMEQLSGMTPLDLKPEYTPEKYAALIAPLLNGEREKVVFETVHRRQDGSLYNVELRLQSSKLENHPVLVAFARDISDRIQAERVVRESEERFRQLADSIHEVFWLVSHDWREVFYVSPAFDRIFGRSRQMIYDRPTSFLDVVHPEDRPILNDRIQRRARGDLRGETEVEYRIFLPDGSIRWLQSKITSIEDEQGQVYRLAGTTEDITEQKMAQDQLWERESQLAHVSRLSTMGEMVAGISHEINQPLYAISNYSNACSNTLQRRQDDESQRALKWTREISKQATRAGQIIKRLANFSRKTGPHRVMIDINELVRDSVQLVSLATRRRNVTVHCRLAAAAPRVLADRIQIEQVMVNLLRNAQEALEHNDVADRQVTVRTCCQHECLEVVVEDNGPGFPQEAASRLFDPFFTTKADGMGMGLAISRSIIESHGGTLSASPNAPRGTCFRFRLPLASDVQQVSP